MCSPGLRPACPGCSGSGLGLPRLLSDLSLSCGRLPHGSFRPLRLAGPFTLRPLVAAHPTRSARLHGTSTMRCLLLQEHQHELRGTDLGQYIASGIVIFDLHSQTVKGAQHLDLTSDRTQYRAYAYSAPTLVDLDRDGRLEIVLGTSMVRVAHLRTAAHVGT